jgi:hypothetical protein
MWERRLRDEVDKVNDKVKEEVLCGQILPDRKIPITSHAPRTKPNM